MPNMSRVLFVGILVVGFVVLFAACKDLEKREQVTTRSGVREETAVKEAETTAEQEGPADTGADTLPPVETLTLWPSDLCDVKPTGRRQRRSRCRPDRACCHRRQQKQSLDGCIGVLQSG